MDRIGSFKVETSFNVTGRGIIAVCQQIDGTVKLGSHTILNFDGRVLQAKITGVDWGKLGDDGIIRWGLVLSFANESIKKRIEKQRLTEQTIEIFY